MLKLALYKLQNAGMKHKIITSWHPHHCMI